MDKATFERVFGSVERVEWIKAQPSVLSGNTPCVNAHIESGGMGRRADARFIVPVTEEEHQWMHQHGLTSAALVFHGGPFDFEAAAARTQQDWLIYWRVIEHRGYTF